MLASGATILAIVAAFSQASSNIESIHEAPDSCSPLELVVARGTAEPSDPTYGVVVGDPLFVATKKLIPDVTGYAVNYPASFDPSSKTKGVADVVSHLKSQSTKCANQKYVLVGYSQGGDVMHNAVAQTDPSLFPRIVALVMFGDPGNKQPNPVSPLGGVLPNFPDVLQQRLKQNCAKADPVCTHDGTALEDHLSYNNPGETYQSQSAEYILKQFKTNGKAGPSPSPNGGTRNADKDNSGALLELGAALGAPPGFRLPKSSGGSAKPPSTMV